MPHARMTAVQYRKWVRRAGMTQADIARLIGFDPRTSRRYAGGHTSIPSELAILLRLFADGTLSKADICRGKSEPARGGRNNK